jgi:DNA-directed RNA polymerase subunit RPC12/RpoP
MKTEWQCPKCKTKKLPKLVTKLYRDLEFSEIIANDIIFEIDDSQPDTQEFIECSSCKATFEFSQDNNFITLEIPAN